MPVPHGGPYGTQFTVGEAGWGGLVVNASGVAHSVGKGRTVSIGRDPECDVVIDDPLVSRRHAVLSPGSDGWVLEDAESRNGTFVDGLRVPRLIVGAGRTVVHLGAADGPQVSIDSVIRIGRDEDNDIILADDLLVSRHHAEIHGSDIVDLGSHNGTFVDGERVSRGRVADGEVIGIGQHQFVLLDGSLREWTAPTAVRFAASGLVVRSPTGVVLLDHVGLALEANGLLAIVGPSGAGKSTLLNALTGFRPADEGAVSYEGRDLYAEYDDLRRRIGLVPQDDVVYPQLTVRAALSYAAELRFPPEVSREERDGRVDAVMAELDLTARADLRIERLSGGQRKRTSVAMEMLTRPSLMFLDEPTSGLDPGYERTLMQLLRDLADGGRTIIVVTHSVSSLYLCDRVLVMAPGGKPAFFGRPGDAPGFFGREDYQGVFQALSEDGGTDWAARFAAAHPQPAATTTAGDREVPRPPKGGFRQFATLTRRYAAVLRADRVNVTLLALQAPALGLLQYVVLPRHELAAPGPGTLRVFSSAAAILLNPVQIATALGLANAVRELVKERSLFRRERAAGLSIPAYLASKAVLLAGVAVVQAAILVAMTLIGEGGPAHALALGRPFVELTAVIAVTGIAAMALGLAMSAMAPTENLAITLLPVVIVLQNVLSMGGLSPASLAKPILNQAQYASSAQWGFAAAAATADINRLQGLSGLLKEVKTLDAATVSNLTKNGLSVKGQLRYRHLRSVWLEDMAALVGLAVAALILAGLALARLDPG